MKKVHPLVKLLFIIIWMTPLAIGSIYIDISPWIWYPACFIYGFGGGWLGSKYLPRSFIPTSSVD